jgi:predicted transcriptional regulator
MGSTKGDKYDLAEPDLKSFTRSSIRTKVMLTLLDGGKTASELEKVMDTRASTILHSIKSLTDNNLVDKKNQEYSLTSIGRIQALILDDLVNTIVTINEHHDFWLHHEMGGIPTELQKRIGMLGQGEIIKDSPESPLKSLDYFIATLSQSKEVLGVSSVVVRGYPEAISNVVNSGVQVELILTNPVLNVVISEQKQLLNDLLASENFKLFSIDKDVKISFTVTESFLNLGLSRIDGSYDLGTDLIYSVEKAIEWGKLLYNHYRDQSNQLENV